MEHIHRPQAPAARLVCFAAALAATVLLAVFVDTLATGYAVAGQAIAKAQPVVVARR